MTLSKHLLVAAGAVCLAAPSTPALAGDFSFGFSFGIGSRSYGDCGSRTRVYYDSCPVVYRDCGPRTVVYRDRSPRRYYRDCGPRTVVYRDRSPRRYYRDSSPRGYYRDCDRRTVVHRDRSTRSYRTSKTHYTRSCRRTSGPSSYCRTSHRVYRSPRYYHRSSDRPRHHARVRVRW